MCSKISTWECMDSDCWTKHKNFLETTISVIWYIGQKFLVYWFRHHIHNLLSKVESWNGIYSLWTNQSWAFDLLNFSLSPYLQNLIQDIPITRTAHLMSIFGLIIRVCVPSNLHLIFFIINIRSHGTQPCGTGYGPYLAPKRSNFSFGRPCITSYPLEHFWPMVDNT